MRSNPAPRTTGAVCIESAGGRALNISDSIERFLPMKLATWNLALPVSARRRAAIRAHTDRERADVWVLTETHDGFSPNHADSSHSSAAGRDGLHKAGHRWVTIWSRFPLEPIATSDDKRTAAARIMPASEESFVVYGTVLPWIGSPWRGHPSAGGVAFREALAVQAADWMRIRSDYPIDELFVLGNFNQDLVTPRKPARVRRERALRAGRHADASAGSRPGWTGRGAPSSTAVSGTVFAPALAGQLRQVLTGPVVMTIIVT